LIKDFTFPVPANPAAAAVVGINRTLEKPNRSGASSLWNSVTLQFSGAQA